jgi:hypothetical protein
MYYLKYQYVRFFLVGLDLPGTKFEYTGEESADS